MFSNTGLDFESQFQDMNSDEQVSNLQLNEIKTSGESDIEDVTKLPLSMSEQFYLRYYVLFENKSNNCWLNCALALLLNNKTLYCNLKSKNDTPLVKILERFRNIMMYIHDPLHPLNEARLLVAAEEVKLVQGLAHTYLQPLLKCKEGKPDSTFNAIMNLIGSDPKAQKLFETSFSRNLECKNCKTVRRGTHKKSVITLTKVESFDGSNPVSLCACPACKIPNQKMFLYYHSLPPCLLFHFENGAGEGVLEQMDFKVGSRTYHLSGVITLTKSGLVPHFVTWFRNPDSNQWLEYNDLGRTLTSFKDSNPEIERHTIHMLCFETLDQMGVITKFGELFSTNNMPCSSEIPEITLSDDNDEENVVQNQRIYRFTAKNSPSVSGGNKFETNLSQSISTAASILSPSTNRVHIAQSTGIAASIWSPSVAEKSTNRVHVAQSTGIAAGISSPSAAEKSTNRFHVAQSTGIAAGISTPAAAEKFTNRCNVAQSTGIAAGISSLAAAEMSTNRFHAAQSTGIAAGISSLAAAEKSTNRFHAAQSTGIAAGISNLAAAEKSTNRFHAAQSTGIAAGISSPSPAEKSTNSFNVAQSTGIAADISSPSASEKSTNSFNVAQGTGIAAGISSPSAAEKSTNRVNANVTLVGKCVFPAETNPVESTSFTVSISSPPVNEKFANRVTGPEGLEENVLQGTTSVEHDAADSGETASFASCSYTESNQNEEIDESGHKMPEKKKTISESDTVMTQYEERLLNLTIDEYLLNHISSHFGFK